MRLQSLLVLALFTLPLAAAEGSDPCVPDGTTQDIDFDLPDPGDGGTKAPGPDAKPTAGGKPFQWGSWEKHPSEALEGDPISDDPMGGVNPTDGGVSVPVKNDGGDLSGPNGEVQNGLGEGSDCIEVYVKATYRVWTKVSVSTTTTVAPEGIGTSRTETEEHWEWKYYTYETEEKEVCPC